MLQSDSPGERLKQLIDSDGSLVYNPDKTMEMLGSACPNHMAEVDALVRAQKISLPWELLNLGPQPGHTGEEELAEDVQAKLGATHEGALWIVQTWAYALGVEFYDAPTFDVGGVTSSTESASATVRYYVVNRENRWGPADISTLNQWAQEGRLHGRMKFEDADSGTAYAANEVPGLFLQIQRQTPLPSFGPSNYYRYVESSDTRRELRNTYLISILGVFFNCLFGVISLGILAVARNCFITGDAKRGSRLLKRARLCSYVAIIVGIAYLASFLMGKG